MVGVVTAAVLAGLAALLAIPTPAGGHLSRLEPTRPRRGSSRRMVWLLVAVLSASLVPVLGMRTVGWLAVGAVAAGTIGWLVRSHRRRRAQRLASDEVARAARVLASLLRAGQLPRQGLAEAALDCPRLASAATAARLGADVPQELRRAAHEPGAEGLAAIAGAWRVAERSGAPIAEVLGEVAVRLRAERALEGVVEAELSAARASGQIMAALPFLAVVLGFAAGADPIAFLFGNPLGELLVLAGVVLTACGVVWIDRLATPKRVAR